MKFLLLTVLFIVSMFISIVHADASTKSDYTDWFKVGQIWLKSDENSMNIGCDFDVSGRREK